MPRYISDDLKNRTHEQYRTPAENSDPKAEIIISRARFSVTDTSQFQVDTIREKSGLGDLGIDLKREDITARPTYIYEVHDDNGEIWTSTRKMPALPANEWVDGVKIDDGTLCRLCFNGDWVWSLQKEKYLFQTEGDPFLFYTDDSDILYVQSWESDVDREQLATTVTVSMDCIRGWREPNATGNDQGLIVAYIKTDGLLYYRQYLWNGVDAYEWQSEVNLTITGITDSFVNVTLFRTNDYRVGFTITTDQDEVYWLITSRQWAGLALRPEALNLSLSISVSRSYITVEDGFTPPEVLEMALSNIEISRLNGIPIEIESAENVNDGGGDYGNTVEVKFNAPIYNYTGLESRFSLWDEDSSVFFLISYGLKAGTDDTLEIVFDDFNGAFGDLTVYYYKPISGGIENEAGDAAEDTEFEFTPTGLVDPGNPAPAYVSSQNIEGSEL